MKENKKCIYLYLLFSFTLAWMIWIGCYWLRVPNIVSQLFAMLSMWAPAIAVWLTHTLTKTENILAYSLKPKIKGNAKQYLYAWIIPIIASILGGLLYFCIFQNDFDISLTYLKQSLDLSEQTSNTTFTFICAGIKFVAIVTFGSLLNTFLCLGEEIGWRGFLFPALAKEFPHIRAHLLAGLIWGLWHTPINMLGHNYGLYYPGYPWLGIISMCVFTFSAGVVLSWLCEKSGTVWVAAFAHGSINAVAGAPMLFLTSGTAAHQVWGPGTTGLIAGLPLFMLAVIILWHSNKPSESC